MTTPLPTDHDLRQLMRRAVSATPEAPAFDDLVSTQSYVTSSVAPSGRRRRSLAVFMASLLTVLGLGGGGYLAYASLIGPDGYDTPTEAVHAFVDALEQGDVLRASRALAPFEREHMDERLKTVLSLATDARALSSNDLAEARHIRLAARGLQLSEHPMAAGFSRVEADAGRLEVTYDPTLFGGAMHGPSRTETKDLVQLFQPHGPDGSGAGRAGFVTVRVDGAWYVSLSYSMVETIRLNGRHPLPDLSSAIVARGAPTPTEAATKALSGYFEGSTMKGFDGLLDVVDPVSGQALFRYLPGLISARAGTSAAKLEPIRSMQWRLEGEGDWRTARLVAVELLIEGTASDGSTTNSYERTDLTRCAATEEHFGCVAFRNFTVALVRRGGRWYIDPIESAGRLVISGIAARSSVVGHDEAKTSSGSATSAVQSPITAASPTTVTAASPTTVPPAITAPTPSSPTSLGN